MAANTDPDALGPQGAWGILAAIASVAFVAGVIVGSLALSTGWREMALSWKQMALFYKETSAHCDMATPAPAADRPADVQKPPVEILPVPTARQSPA